MENRDSRMWFYLMGGILFFIITVNVVCYDVYVVEALRAVSQ